jgi:hypothetical protein
LETSSEEAEDEVQINGTLSAKPEFCDLMPEIGPCEGQWSRFYYNSSRDVCDTFDYGGCDGNENNFHSILACQAICKKPNQTEDDLIFQIIFGTPKANLKADVSEGQQKDDIFESSENLTLTFDDDFQNWHVDNWSLLRFDTFTARQKNITAFNGSSKAAATPKPHFTPRPK